jgi:Holliday junction resolvasome RuvABC endonuclease subunit
MNILGLDQATKTGYAIFKDGMLEQYGVIDASSTNDFTQRIVLIKNETQKLIQKYKISAVALEEVTYQRNPNTLKKLSKLLGVLEVSLLEQRLAYDILTPSEWRSACAISGTKRKEQKKNTQKWVENKFGMVVSEDEADAIGIGWTLVKKMGV